MMTRDVLSRINTDDLPSRLGFVFIKRIDCAIISPVGVKG